MLTHAEISAILAQAQDIVYERIPPNSATESGQAAETRMRAAALPVVFNAIINSTIAARTQ